MVACHCRVCTSADPKDKRLRSSVLLQEGDVNIVVDTTPDFRYQMLRTGTDHLDAVLITHAHKDHIAGMDDVRAFNYFQGHPIDVYATAPSAQAIRAEFHYAFQEKKYPGVPEINLRQIDLKPFQVQGWNIIPVEVMHFRLPVYGFRIGDFTYITDANYISAQEKEKIRGSRVLVLNALRREQHISHFTLQEALALADELAIPQLYMTHISHQMGRHAEVSLELPPGRALAYDGLELEL